MNATRRFKGETSFTTDEFKRACAENADRWVPGCGGNEQPFTKNGVRYLYCYNPRRMAHAYLNLDTDLLVGETLPDLGL